MYSAYFVINVHSMDIYTALKYKKLLIRLFLMRLQKPDKDKPEDIHRPSKPLIIFIFCSYFFLFTGFMAILTEKMHKQISLNM